jgi:hypothetical protein
MPSPIEFHPTTKPAQKGQTITAFGVQDVLHDFLHALLVQ